MISERSKTREQPLARRPHAVAICGVGLVCLLLIFLISLDQGSGSVGLRDILTYLWNRSNGTGLDSSFDMVASVWQMRFPRVLAALMVGGGLAASATMLQTLTRNPLAEPGLLGVNAGAVFGLTLGVAAFGVQTVRGYMLWSGVGAFAATILVLLVGGLAQRTSPPRLILIGIAVSAALGGAANYVLLSSNASLETFRFWNLGSLSGVRMSSLSSTAPWFFLSALVILGMTRWLGVMQLGDDQAKSMGVPTGVVSLLVWLTTAILTACAISIAGPVMFAGFLAAYGARFIAGPRFALQLFCSVILGMLLVAAADVCARIIIAPYEIPVGVVIALIGSPLTVVAARTRIFRASLLEEQ